MLVQRFKANWARYSTRDKLLILAAIVFAAIASGLYAERNERRGGPLNREAFMKGCQNTGSAQIPKALVENYCTCVVDKVTPEMASAARSGAPQLTEQMIAAAQSCSKDLGG
jgi:hypothetical protein